MSGIFPAVRFCLSLNDMKKGMQHDRSTPSFLFTFASFGLFTVQTWSEYAEKSFTKCKACRFLLG